VGTGRTGHTHTPTMVQTNSLLNQNAQRPTSYQSIISSSVPDTPTNGTGERSVLSTPWIGTCGIRGVWSPMQYLKQRDHQYRKLVTGLFIVVLIALMSSLTYVGDDKSTIGYQRAKLLGMADHTENDDFNFYDDDYMTTRQSEKDRRQEQTANDALDALNHDLFQQYRAMPKGCETTLLILRHCEKNGLDARDSNGNYHCNHLGYERARYIATLFGNTTTTTSSTRTHVSRWPNPSYLYALTDIRKRHKNFREWETLRPLSESIHVPIHLILPDPWIFSHDTYMPMVRSGELCGKLVVVAWKHSLFPVLANAVGCGPDQGCPTFLSEDDYGSVWQIKLLFLDNPNTLHDGNHREMLSLSRHWHVYGTVVPQEFDPLAFSSAYQDLP
jgi:hypothetical protein